MSEFHSRGHRSFSSVLTFSTVFQLVYVCGVYGLVHNFIFIRMQILIHMHSKWIAANDFTSLLQAEKKSKNLIGWRHESREPWLKQSFEVILCRFRLTARSIQNQYITKIICVKLHCETANSIICLPLNRDKRYAFSLPPPFEQSKNIYYSSRLIWFKQEQPKIYICVQFIERARTRRERKKHAFKIYICWKSFSNKR